MNYIFATSSSSAASGSSAKAISARMDTMKAAEAALMSFTNRFGPSDDVTVELIDTPIRKSAMTSLESATCRWFGRSTKKVATAESAQAEDLNLHGIKVQKGASKDIPLVLLHGYANGALYYYRNLMGLAESFGTVYSLDLMGWGLSSRPSFTLKENTVDAAEAFFVDSLEEWRKQQKVEKMILAGHSMGGYISVAYCERYPQHVEKLILLSPVGVPDPKAEEATRKARGLTPSRNASVTWKVARSVFTRLWEWDVTPGGLLRSLSTARATNMVTQYVTNRLPAIDRPDERQALISYLYTNAMLPPSGEHCLNRILLPVAYARRPTVDRIPLLKVSDVTFVYGQNDWMDVSGGMQVQQNCKDRRETLLASNPDVAPEILKFPPNVTNYIVKDAGHLLMLENWQEFNAAVILAAGKSLNKSHPQPELVTDEEIEHLLADHPAIRHSQSAPPTMERVSSTSSEEEEHQLGNTTMQ